MRPIISILFLAVLPYLSNATLAEETVQWPGNIRTAVSLSYDDALNSHLDHAAPALDKYGFRASFYLTLVAEPIRTRMDEWRGLARRGHELGNHTIYHACSGSLPGRDWVTEINDLDNRSLEEIVLEVVTANAVLQAIDGVTQRTFTPPCDDLIVEGENYLPLVEEHFVAVKGQDNGMAAGSTPLYIPAGESGQELIDYVRNNTRDGMLLNILFHGVGGDHLSVSKEAHEALLKFLSEHTDIYWTDTYINIMSYVNGQR
jgi:peptidoglycan/xylan/chitin deacetylase (PgdA/CDA1 family)